MFGLLLREMHGKTFRRCCRCKRSFRRNESTTTLASSLKSNKYTRSEQRKSYEEVTFEHNDHDKNDDTMDKYMADIDEIFPYSLNHTLNQNRIFQSSSFKTLSISDHGSLVQESRKTSNLLRQHSEESFSSGGYLVDEEELNVNFPDYESPENGRKKRRTVNSIRSAMKKNPNESLTMSLVGKFHDYKIISSSLDEFYKEVIGDENSIKNYNFEIPIFPQSLDISSFRSYLCTVNSIDFSYDSKGYEKAVFYSMYYLAKNIHKLEGIADLNTMHHFLKYFCDHGMIRTAFKIIDMFESIGIMPNRQTLHLLIYKLNRISNQDSRKDLLKLYLIMGQRKWKCSTDLTTKALIYFIEKPSKKRLALAKSLRNEGVAHSLLKWEMLRDYVAIELNNRSKTDFRRMMSHLKRLALLEDNREQICKLFEIYIDTLVQRNKTGIALDQILAYPQYEKTENWRSIMIQLFKNNEIWSCFAVVNIVKEKKKLDLRRVVFPLLHNYKKVYEFFTTQKFEKYDERYLYCNVMNLLQDLCHTEMTPVIDFISTVILKGEMPIETFQENIRKEFNQIQIWDGKNRKASRFFPIVSNRMAMDSIMRLWDVYVTEGEKVSLDMLSVDPISFPWRPLR